jgi:drug/metabolite transporter (DMT)-like permease
LLSYVLAVLAACANAASSVLQRKANKDVSTKENLSWRLIVSLFHRPVWFAGIAAICLGFLLQATALGFGELATVEPILILELPLTLIIASRMFGHHMERREWLSSAAMSVGLGGLLFLLSPSAGRNGHVRWYGWVFGIVVNLVLVAGLVALGRRGSAGGSGSGSGGSGGGPGGGSGGAYRAALLGIAGGSAFGLTAALMKGMTTTFSHGLVDLFTSWEIYGMVAAGLLGMFLVQSALNAGGLIAAQPGLTLSDPVISVLWGVFAFHEQVRGGWYILPEVVAAAIVGGAVLALARSPLLADAAEET